MTSQTPKNSRSSCSASSCWHCHRAGPLTSCPGGTGPVPVGWVSPVPAGTPGTARLPRVTRTIHSPGRQSPHGLGGDTEGKDRPLSPHRVSASQTCTAVSPWVLLQQQDCEMGTLTGAAARAQGHPGTGTPIHREHLPAGSPAYRDTNPKGHPPTGTSIYRDTNPQRASTRRDTHVW